MDTRYSELQCYLINGFELAAAEKERRCQHRVGSKLVQC